MIRVSVSIQEASTALLGGPGRGAEQGTDLVPGQRSGAGVDYGVRSIVVRFGRERRQRVERCTPRLDDRPRDLGRNLRSAWLQLPYGSDDET